MSLIGVALIVLALIVLFLMRARRGVSKLMDQPFLNSMAAAAISKYPCRWDGDGSRGFLKSLIIDIPMTLMRAFVDVCFWH